MIQLQAHSFMPSQTACQQKCAEGRIALSFHALIVGSLPECVALLGRQPVAEPDAQLLNAFHASNAGRKVGAEEATVGGLIGQAAYGTQS